MIYAILPSQMAQIPCKSIRRPGLWEVNWQQKVDRRSPVTYEATDSIERSIRSVLGVLENHVEMKIAEGSEDREHQSLD